jgi:hypothetical protein
MNLKNFMIFSAILFALFLSCENPEGKPYRPTKIDKLEFMVPHSDLIAIVEVTNGIDKYNAKPSMNKYSVNAEVKKVIIGNDKDRKITILNTPSFKNENTIESFLALYNGQHLVFLKRHDSSYRPVSASSILEIVHNRVYPVWKQSETKSDISIGYDLSEIVNEIINSPEIIE